MRSKYEMKISKNHTMPIDGFKENGTNSNLLVIGSSGTGKTTSIVLPMLLDNFDKEPVTFVVQDCKGTLYKNLSKKFIDDGYDVKVLDFTKPSKSNVYNPLRYIKTIDDARKIITPIVLSQVKSVKDMFWEIASIDLLSSLTMFIKDNFASMFLDFACLNRVLNIYARDFSNINKAKKDTVIKDYNLDRLFKPHYDDTNKIDNVVYTSFYCKIKKLAKKKNSPQYLSNLETCFSYAEATFNSIIAVSKGALAIYTGKEIKKVICGQDQMNLDNLANKKTIIFVNPSDTSRIYDAIVGSFYNLCFEKIIACADRTKQGRLRIPFRMIIDDFASGVKIQDFDKIISNIRSRNISCTLLLQSISQLESLYGKTEANTIIANCATQIYLGSNDFEQELYMSKRLNKTYNEVHEMDRTKLVIFGENKKTIIDDKYYFKNHPNYNMSGFDDKRKYANFKEIDILSNIRKIEESHQKILKQKSL